MHVEGVMVREHCRGRALETAYRWQKRLMTWLRHHWRVAAIMELLGEAAGWWPYH
jgi:hypothetical protein